MHVIGHQHIGADHAARLAGAFVQAFEKEAKIFVGNDADLPGVASVDHVQ